MLPPVSCDTFVALPPATGNGCIVFGKNSDRPCAEVQEVIHVSAADHDPGSKLQCTYIEIDQVAHTHAVILSRPSWLWGAEMGANEHGVCIGNEAVWTKLNGPDDLEERLLGMDLVRLGLERGSSAQESLDVMTGLLEKYGQGGTCSDDGGFGWSYHNSYIIADGQEAWVLETLGRHWAAEQVKSGVRNISNQLTIRTKIDAMSPGLKDMAKSKGFWKGDGEFDFAKVFSDSFEETELGNTENPDSRQLWGTKLLRDFSKQGNFGVQDMFKILRHEESGICMTGGFLSTGSQVSLLRPKSESAPSCHWFTATPNPAHSFFKPYIFTESSTIGDKTLSPNFGTDDPAKVIPRFQKQVNREHPLWIAHKKLLGWLDSGDPRGEELLKQIKELESHCIADMEEVASNFNPSSCAKVAAIFQHMVDLEMNFYK